MKAKSTWWPGLPEGILKYQKYQFCVYFGGPWIDFTKCLISCRKYCWLWVWIPTKTYIRKELAYYVHFNATSYSYDKVCLEVISSDTTKIIFWAIFFLYSNFSNKQFSKARQRGRFVMIGEKVTDEPFVTQMKICASHRCRHPKPQFRLLYIYIWAVLRGGRSSVDAPRFQDVQLHCKHFFFSPQECSSILLLFFHQISTLRSRDQFLIYFVRGEFCFQVVPLGWRPSIRPSIFLKQ
jgi:hypothetical protein